MLLRQCKIVKTCVEHSNEEKGAVSCFIVLISSAFWTVNIHTEQSLNFMIFP